MIIDNTQQYNQLIRDILTKINDKKLISFNGNFSQERPISAIISDIIPEHSFLDDLKTLINIFRT